jgi:hypothetical protein
VERSNKRIGLCYDWQDRALDLAKTSDCDPMTGCGVQKLRAGKGSDLADVSFRKR